MDPGAVPGTSTMKPSTLILAFNHIKFEVQVSQSGPCRLWLGGTDRDGYGSFQFSYEGKKYKIRAHVARFMLSGKTLKKGEIVRHTCDTRLCVKTAHLVAGTHADNVADRVARGRSASGLRNGRAKLSEEAIREIRFSGLSIGWLSQKHGVDPKAIRYHREKII